MEKDQAKAYEEEKKITEKISKINNRIVVFSGKGGVGKTTMSVNLGYGFQTEGYSTGLLDADITGPNVSKMLGIKDDLIVLNETIIPHERHGLKSISIANIIQPGQPVIWRGPMRSKIINQFLGDVEWGELDYLISDLPPGTGDEIITIAQMMKPNYAVIVTTPQDVSIVDAERAINMAIKMEIPNIGIIENMAGFICPKCGEVVELFGYGGGEKLAKKTGVEFLGSVPFEVETRELSDKGTPILIKNPKSNVSNKVRDIVFKIMKSLKEKVGKEN